MRSATPSKEYFKKGIRLSFILAICWAGIIVGILYLPFLATTSVEPSSYQEKLVKGFKEAYPATSIESVAIGDRVEIYATEYKFTDSDLRLAEKLARDNGYNLTAFEIRPSGLGKIVVVFYFTRG
jgi:hypothetical protein